MDNYMVMVEAVVAHDEAKEIFRAFCEERRALRAQISPKDAVNDSITAGFESDNVKKTVIGKIEKMFPGKISWR